ncbi:hypothetical protein [Paenibacillus albus]|uniref:DUF4328 domain-containing protein n=1 Tax=Paenibacillus albus TaxID=2495582 RepID=A0A3Q8X5E4_9BACL|nr:hypothetical protein [Paenibacillus albus]AZN39636.1 hypothetical protein EJC50_08240 [Paenibacillus albus]
MKLKSEVLSNVMRIMLTILIAVTLLDFVGSLLFAISESLYMDSFNTVFSMISTIKVVLYFTICLVYLVWIYMVHVDLCQFIDPYPRSPLGALAAMIIPIYSFYGLPSTFSRMGHQLEQHSSTQKLGSRIGSLSAPLIILLLFNIVMNRLLQLNSNEAALFIASDIIALALYMLFLLLTRYISQSLSLLAASDASAEVSQQTNVLGH